MYSIALIDPLGDYGIGTYTYELGQGLAANGARVDAYVADAADVRDVPLHPNHRRFLVLGSRLRKLAPRDRSSSVPANVGKTVSAASSRRMNGSAWRMYLRARYLTLQLVLHLKRRGYDVVWTQWPEMESYPHFWLLCRMLRIRLVHTVHNIFPHERSPGDLNRYARVYASADTLIVHSPQVRSELAQHFPRVGSKTVVIPHGAYTIYPRDPTARERLRARLGIANGARVVLFAGAVRPYKNITAAIDAFAMLALDDVILLVAGREQGAPSGNPLAATTSYVEQAGLASKVRFYGGYLDIPEMGALYEAADILLLPYLKSYGSGQLMLAVTFGKYVVATRPGMEDVLVRYPRAVVLDAPDALSVRDGLVIALERLRSGAEEHYEIPEAFDWITIGADSLRAIRR